MSEKKIEQNEQNETEIELEVKPVKSLKTNLKGGAACFDFGRPTSGRNCFSDSGALELSPHGF